MALAAVVFDFDGLIVDTEWPEYRSVADVFEDYGLEFPPEDWVHVIGSSWDVDWVGDLETRLGRPVERDAVRARRRARSRELRVDLQPLPGVLALLDVAESAGLALAVASSSSRDWVEGQLAQLGLLERFALTRCLDDVELAKPAPDLYVAVCTALGVDPATAVALEDSANGTTAAKHAGLGCVAVPNRLTRYLDLSHADLVVDSLLEVDLDVLAGVAGRLG